MNSMKKIKKIAIIGHFGGKENFNDGQTVKTVNLYKELLKSTNWKISKVDTYYKSKNPFVLFIKTIISIMSTKNIIVLCKQYSNTKMNTQKCNRKWEYVRNECISRD